MLASGNLLKNLKGSNSGFSVDQRTSGWRTNREFDSSAVVKNFEFASVTSYSDRREWQFNAERFAAYVFSGIWVPTKSRNVPVWDVRGGRRQAFGIRTGELLLFIPKKVAVTTLVLKIFFAGYPYVNNNLAVAGTNVRLAVEST